MSGWRATALRVRRLRSRIDEGSDRRTPCLDGEDFRKAVERYVEAPRIVDLRNQGNIRQARLVAKTEGCRLDQYLDRGEAFQDPVPVPAVHGFLIMAELPAEISQYGKVVHGVNVAGDDRGDGAHAGSHRVIER